MREIDQELFDAVKQGNLDSVRGCLSKCADVSGTDGDGKTPLHYAAQKGKLEVTKFLVEKGANVNAETLGGSKPIHFAVDGDNQRIIEFLLNKGANVNDTNNYGWTPLHWAADDGKLEVAKFLVSKGADVHAIKPTRSSSFFGNLAAKVAGFMGYGDTPLDVAREKGHKEIVIYLLDEEARMLWRKREYEKAFEAFKEVFNIQKVKLGPDHPNTLNANYGLEK